MKYVIFTGFLGAGKTMAINSFARMYSTKFPAALSSEESTEPTTDVKIVIIENEIGETNYDAELLGDRGYTVSGMVSGCICCSLSAELTIAIKRILSDIAPECIILEPTGIASPSKVLEVLYGVISPEDEVKVVAIVDATRYDAILEWVPHLLNDQMENANLILVNKTDAANKRDVRRILNNIRNGGYKACVKPVSFSESVDAGIWSTVL